MRALPPPYAEPEDESISWGEMRRYLEAPLRRPLTVLVPWLSIALLSVMALFVLPKKYKSSTLILVESEKMPDSFVPKVATDDRTARLEAIRPEILSRTRLESVLQATKPYPEIDSTVHAVEKMRGSTYIMMSGNDGFTIDFTHSDPYKAQEVCDHLARLFISETVKSREAQVTGAVEFLETQVTDARKELEKKDEALRKYKQLHMGRLPEQLQTNLATMQMFQRELQGVEESLLFARERLQGLQRPSRASVRSTPDPGGAPGDDVGELRRQLAALSGRYTDEHPDVMRLRARIERLERAAAGTHASAPESGMDATTRAQLEAANIEVKRLEDKRADLERRIASTRGNVEDTPRTEQELTTLTRDYQKLNENYTALLAKQLEAQMAGRLEQRWKGDQFRMLDPASLPEKPYFPKPLLVIGMGIALGLFVGIGASLLIEFLDPTVKSTQDLQSSLGYPVLACIPHLAGLGPTPERGRSRLSVGAHLGSR